MEVIYVDRSVTTQNDMIGVEGGARERDECKSFGNLGLWVLHWIVKKFTYS